MLKKIIIAMNICMMMFLVGCNNAEEDKGNTNTNPDTDTNPDKDNDDDEKDEDSDLPKINLHGDEFVIMVNDAKLSDPRSEDYENLYRDEKVKLIAEAEAKYNCKVVYKTYPSNASWGEPRTQYIIEQSGNTETKNHVYEIGSIDIGKLGLVNAITPLTKYIETYGNKGYWKNKLNYSEFNGEYYGYADHNDFVMSGLFFNVDLIKKCLPNQKLPDQMWLDREWTWKNFTKLTDDLNGKLDENLTDRQYVLGGKTWDYMYGFLGSNNQYVVNNDFEIQLLEEENAKTLKYLHDLRNKTGMWLDDAAIMGGKVQPEWVKGNIAFHCGENWEATSNNRWGTRKWDIGFVPFPVGDTIVDDYINNDISKVRTNAMSTLTFVISSAFKKENIPAGYEDQYLHDETIFRIWSDLQYFEEIDPTTNEAKYETQKMEYFINRLEPVYATEASRNAHLEVLTNINREMFYAVEEARNVDEGSYQLMIEEAFHSETALRSTLESMVQKLKANLIKTYKLGADHDFTPKKR